MSILIKGLFGKEMPMPQEGYVDIRIHFKSGKLKCVTMPIGEDPFYATFDVEKLPPHGRLIDADKIDFRNDAMHDGTGNLVVADNFINGILWLNDCIDRTPTVIEAEGSET